MAIDYWFLSRVGTCGAMPVGYCALRGLNMKLVSSLLVFAIAGGVVPAVEAGQKASPDPVSAKVGLAQAISSGSTANQSDYLFKTCKDTTSLGDPNSADRGVDPVYMLINFLQDGVGHITQFSEIKNLVLLHGAAHGELAAHVTGDGKPYYMYNPTAAYQGNDQATFMAEFQGKRYKILVDLKVWAVPALGDAETCPPPQLIKVNGQSVSGAAVGQAIGTNITLDTSAATATHGDG